MRKMKLLVVASLVVSAAASVAFAGSPSGTYAIRCTNAKVPDCEIRYSPLQDKDKQSGGSSPIRSGGAGRLFAGKKPEKAVGNFDYIDAGYLEYTDSLFEDGWDKVTVTMDTYDDIAGKLTLDQKYYAMGYLEGYVTYERIYQNHINVKHEFMEALTPEVVGWIGNNTAWMEKFAKANARKDRFAAKLGNMLQQIKGMSAGYQAACAKNGQQAYAAEIDETMMYLINLQAEIGDIIAAYEPESEFVKNWHSPENQHCSALVKPVKGDLFLSHLSWVGYHWMMRQYKTYRFEVAAVTIAGHPGMIHSMDDWYMTGKKLAVFETTIIVNDMSLFVEHLRDKYEVVPAFLRVMISNYLATDIYSWMELNVKYNSGTYNNQWVIVDMNKYTGDPVNIPDGVLGVLETVPGHFASGDQTATLRKLGYWPSYNFAFYDDIRKLADYQSLIDLFGWGMSYDGYNRARIFARDANNVTDLATMEALMEYNDYKNDPLSTIPNCTGAINNTCVPARSAMLSISARGDLNPPGGKERYGIMLNMVGQRNHAGIDMKVASWTGMTQQPDGALLARIKNGPSTSHGMPVFKFSTCPFEGITHLGLPDEWNFPTLSVSVDPRNPYEDDDMKMKNAPPPRRRAHE